MATLIYSRLRGNTKGVDKVSRMPFTLPSEIWAQIAEHCSPKTLKALSIVCHSCCDEARRRLYRNVHFCEGIYHEGRRSRRPPAIAPERTHIVDLALFYQSLITWTGWRDAVQEVRLEWGNGINHAGNILREGPETEAQHRFNNLVENTAKLLSQSSSLRIFHLSLPLLDSTVPFHVGRIDSLKVPLDRGRNEDKDLGFATLLKLFQIPSLHRVELANMARLDCVVPESSRHPGTSDVKELRFLDPGPISEELVDLLRWPKDLQSLEFDRTAPGLAQRGVAPRTTIFPSVQHMINTLSSVKHSLQNLYVKDATLYGLGPYQGGAFQAFSKLRRIRMPRDVFIALSDDPVHPGYDDYDVAPPIHTQLPKSLQELHIDVESLFYWRYEERVADGMQDEPYPHARELLASLSGLADAKADCFPELHRLHIWHHEYSAQYPLDNQWDFFPLVCDGTRDFVELLREKDIDVYFNGFSGTDLLDGLLFAKRDVCPIVQSSRFESCSVS